MQTGNPARNYISRFFTGILLLAFCPAMYAQHSFIAFYPDTQAVGLAATVDSAGEFDGEYIAYYKTGHIIHSGQFSHGHKTGHWTYYFYDGKKEREDWYSPVDTSIIRTRAYDDYGFLRGSIERIKDDKGEIVYYRHYTWEGHVRETEQIYSPPRNTIKNIVNRYSKSSGNRITYTFTDGTMRDTLFDEQGRLKMVRTEEWDKTFYPNGNQRSYMSRDTESTWYENGALLSLSVRLQSNRINILSPEGGEILPPGFIRYWSADGQLLQENYDFPVFLRPGSRVRLCNENGNTWGEGGTDDKGLKHGYWRYYSYTAAGDQYTAAAGAYDHGCRIGVWRSWYEGNKLRSELTYCTYVTRVFRQSLYNSVAPRGECDRIIVLKDRGKKIKVRVNVITGKGFVLFPDSSLQATFNTTADGTFDGTWTMYNAAGKIISRKIYREGQLSDSSYWTYPSTGNMARIIYYDSTGLVKLTKTFDPDTSGQLIRRAKYQLPIDPFWFFTAHTDGLGKSYIGSQKKGKQDYKNMKQYKKTYRKKPMEYTPRYDWPWIKQ